MNTSLLRYAVTYAACGSAQKAAERLGVSRSSVTRNIKRLEEELGAPLFIAAPDGVVPTYTGDICLRYAREILNVEEDLSFDLAEDGVYQGSVSIGMGANRAQRVLPVVLPEFHRRYPGISVQLYELSTADISIGLMNQRLDFAVVGQSHTTSGISFEPLMTERLVLVAPKEDSFARDHSYQLGGIPTVRLEDFSKKQFILGFPNQKSRLVSDRIFKSLSLDVKIVFQTLNSVTAALLAYNGLAYALVPESCTFERENHIPHYHLAPELDAEWIIGIATLDKYPLSPAARLMRNLVRRICGV